MHGLADLRIVDLSHEIAGPYATKLLADAGADVVKVEPEEGHSRASKWAFWTRSSVRERSESS